MNKLDIKYMPNALSHVGSRIADVEFGTVVIRSVTEINPTIYLVVSPMDASGHKALVTLGGGTLKHVDQNTRVFPVDAQLRVGNEDLAGADLTLRKDNGCVVMSVLGFPFICRTSPPQPNAEHEADLQAHRNYIKQLERELSRAGTDLDKAESAFKAAWHELAPGAIAAIGSKQQTPKHRLAAAIRHMVQTGKENAVALVHAQRRVAEQAEELSALRRANAELRNGAQHAETILRTRDEQVQFYSTKVRELKDKVAELDRLNDTLMGVNEQLAIGTVTKGAVIDAFNDVLFDMVLPTPEHLLTLLRVALRKAHNKLSLTRAPMSLNI
jgi:hypothetical protein